MNKSNFIAKTLLSLLFTLFPVQQLQSIDFNINDKNLQNTIAIAAATAAISYAGYLYATQPAPQELPTITIHNLATEKLHFGQNFSWGVCTSSTQTEETSNNHGWSQTYLDKVTSFEKIYTNVKDLHAPQNCCKSFEHWQDDIDKVLHLGCTSYRFSIEWSRIQPEPGVFDQDAINHYVVMAKYCKAHGLKMMCCLHHYSDPIWFLQMHDAWGTSDLTGFAEKGNIPYFVAYCQKMYEALRPYVDQWIVISQPIAYAIKGYKVGLQSPFLKNSGLENIVMLNLLNAHIAVYDMMHKIYNENPTRGLQPEVGICHQIVQMQAFNQYNPLEQLVAQCADRLNNQSFLRFFSTGHLQGLTPMIDIAYVPDAPTKFDFFALSYYSPLAFNWITPVAPTCPADRTTKNFRIIDEQGMYNAIQQAAALGKPVYVVENGIDARYDQQRELLFNAYLSAISKAITDGYDVRGYMHWTLMDNYEWGNGTGYADSPAYGLYKNRVINDATGELHPEFKNNDKMLKRSGHYYKNIIATQKN